ncbi:hypothetical protein F2Q70_00001058 [Brassica cretica]|uniref:Uncharacterized protein n=1 Tax=Brassica cretica TaxID=69181 RepID=A0A3N6Q8U7_BRACR|nr:hypothetical protein F2Q70_00001058 [Brassica cretica]KAF3563436.1 hypothetical protein DY000_02012074 [Brassica cretica]
MGAVSMLFSIPVAMRHERSAEGLAGDEETGDFGYTSLYGQLPDYDKKRTESVESLATPFVSSERPWETIFSGSTLNFPPLQKLCGEFFESLMEKRTVVVEWVMIYTKKLKRSVRPCKRCVEGLLTVAGYFVAKKGMETKLKRRLHVVFHCSNICFVNGLSFSSQGVAFSSSVWFSSERLFYFSPRIYGTKLRQGSKVLNLWYTARVSSAFECVDASEILASGGDISF